MSSLLHQATPSRLPFIREEATDSGTVILANLFRVEKQGAVLRQGESIESFFELAGNMTPGYENLCRQLVASPTPTLWKQVLQKTATTEDNLLLLRLYRRCTLLYPLDGQEKSADVLDIWLDYARAQSSNEAKRTLQFIGNNLWTQSYAKYFLCRATMEPKRAFEYLSQGLENSAEPTSEIQKALRSLGATNDDEPTQRVATTHRLTSSPATNKLDVRITAALAPTCKGLNPLYENNSLCKGAAQLDARYRGKGLLLDTPIPLPTCKHVKLSSTTSKSKQSKLDKEISNHLAKRNDKIQMDNQDVVNKLQNNSKPPLAAKKGSTLASQSKASSYKSAIKEDLSYILNWDPTKTMTNAKDRKRSSKQNDHDESFETSSRPQSIRRKDLDYMFNWNPTSRTNTTKEATGSSNGTTTSIDSAISSQPKNESSPLPTVGPQRNIDSSAVDADFAPLIRTENIIRVNNIPYMKLGDIGKGGSCTVFRVMSKEGSIFALKRVNLENLDAVAIDGYANEIALLRRLSENPAIIQLHDSEVVPKKFIYLVMEVGEVDLNYVLRKQSQDGRLNINFIRLTWMQMLKAVHSMHEERIIHGDLKPANFLFVKGCLKLIDFGIAKSIENDDTINVYRDNAQGTFNYMSPESLLDSGVDPNEKKMRCGKMIYGRTPFAAFHDLKKLQAIVNPSQNIVFPEAEPAAIESIKLCLDKNPARRAPIIGPNGLLEHRFLQSGSV